MQRSRFCLILLRPCATRRFRRKSFDIVAELSEYVKHFFEKFEVFLQMLRFSTFATLTTEQISRTPKFIFIPMLNENFRFRTGLQKTFLNFQQ